MAEVHPIVRTKSLCSASICMGGRRRYEKKVKDYNFGSLIRTDAREEYGEKNTIFGSFVGLCGAFLWD